MWALLHLRTLLFIIDVTGGLQLYVNRMSLYYVNDQSEEHIKSIEYLYVDGDVVDVRCVGWSQHYLPGILSTTYNFGDEPAGLGMYRLIH